MKKIFWFIILSCLLGTGCSYLDRSDAYYEAERAKWQAKQAAAVAYNSKIETKLVEVDSKTGMVSVYNQNQAKPIELKSDPNPWVEGLKTVSNAAATKIGITLWGAERVLRTGGADINASGNATVTSTSNSNNATELQYADGNLVGDTTTDDNSIVDDHSDNSSVDDNSDNSSIDDNSDNSDSHDATAEPFIPEVTPADE
jgi:hypothetical protein